MERIGRANIVGYDQELLGYATRALEAVPGPHLVDTAPDKAALESQQDHGARWHHGPFGQRY